MALSDTQLVVLSAACQRPDRSVYPLTTKLPGGAAGLSALTSSFTKLGLKADTVTQAAGVLTSFVTKTGGPQVGSLLAGALK